MTISMTRTDTPDENMARVLDWLFEDRGQRGWKNDPSTANTAARFLKYLEEYRMGYSDQDYAKEIFASTFVTEDHECHSLQVQSGIKFLGVCEHHLLPMWGSAALGYLPQGKVLGLSKLARLVDMIGHERPSLQEKYVSEIARRLREGLDTPDVGVIISSQHGCMQCRGIKSEAVTHTSQMDGKFRQVPELRQEFMRLAGY